MKKSLILLFAFLMQSNLYSACEIYDLNIDRTDCNHENKFYLVINFKYRDVGECFTIKGNGRNYGTFKYHQLPVTIGPLNGDCKTEYEFIIRDCKNEHCMVTEFYGKVCCDQAGCEFSEMHVDRTDCDNEGNFCAIIDFNHSGNSTCFRLSGNGKEFGKFSYSQLPVKICGLTGDCETDYEFTAKDCEDWECQTTGYLGIVCCEKPCRIYDVHLEKSECDESGKFYVHINFKHDNTSKCFRISGNGKDYGQYDYSQLPVKIGPLEGDCKTLYDFKISDCENEHCFAVKELGKVCCEKKHCEIKDLRITKSDCDPLNNFYVTINFRYFHTSQCFKVRGNGNSYGTFNYSQLPITIGPLKADCKKQFEFIITDCEMENCKASKNIGRVCCEHKQKEGDSFKGNNGYQQNSDSAENAILMKTGNFAFEIKESNDKLVIQNLENISGNIINAYLLNSIGHQIKTTRLAIQENTIEFDTNELIPGLYLLVIKRGEEQWVYKFVK